MKHKNEQFDRLLLQFMDEAQAQQFQDDLRIADTLYETYPAKSPRPEAVSAISNRVHHKLRQRSYWIATEWLTLAAAVVIGAVVAGLFLLYSPTPENPLTATAPRTVNHSVLTRIWHDAYFANAIETDPIEKELADLTESIRSVDMDVYESTDTLNIDLMEIEEMESLAENTSFWKG